MKSVFMVSVFVSIMMMPSLGLHAQPPKQNYKYQLSMTAMFKDESFYLKEWVEYHLLAGVEHFWLYNNSSTDRGMEILAPYIQKGIVEVFDWPIRDSTQSWKISEEAKQLFVTRIHLTITHREAYQDALKRSYGKTKWLALIDLDEFLLPMQDRTITECLEKHFARASAVHVNWLTFGTSNVILDDNESVLCNLTRCSVKSSSANKLGKSIVRPEHIVCKNMLLGSLNVHYFIIDKRNHYYYNGNADVIKGDYWSSSVLGQKTYMSVFARGHYEKFIRLNHYKMGDEKYFKERRLGKYEAINANSGHDIFKQYHKNNESEDTAIVEYIKNKHSENYKALWDNNSKQMHKWRV